MQPPTHQQETALATLRVAAAVLIGGWCSAAVLGLASWSLVDRVAGFPMAYFALPLLAVFGVTYATDGRSQRSLGEALVAGWTGFLIGSLPVFAVLPGQPEQWMVSLAGLSVAALAMAGLAATSRSMRRRRDAAALAASCATATPTS